MPIKELEKLSEKARQGKNYSAFEAGSLEDLFQYELQNPRNNRKVKGKLFLREILKLTSMQVSLNRFPPGVGVPFMHKHKENEELYIFIKGKGQMQIDGETLEVEEGTVIRVAPEGERVWRNNSNEDLYFIVIQGKDGSLSQDTFEDGVPLEAPPTW